MYNMAKKAVNVEAQDVLKMLNRYNQDLQYNRMI